MPKLSASRQQVRQIGRALSGGLRWCLGAFWLEIYVRLNAGQPTDALFAATWKAAARLRFLFAGGETYRNRFGRNWREMLLLRLLRAMERCGKPRPPQIKIVGANILDACRGRPTIVITMHSPIDAVLNRVFQEAGLPSTLLVDKTARINRKANLLGLRGSLDTIGRTSDALLMMRRKLHEGRLICACVDFTWPTDGSFEVGLRISPAMFELARSLRTTLIYAESWVTDDGVVKIAIATPRTDISAAMAAATSADFIAWMRDDLGDCRPMATQKWTRKEKRRSGLLKLPAATARPDRAVNRLSNCCRDRKP